MNDDDIAPLDNAHVWFCDIPHLAVHAPDS